MKKWMLPLLLLSVTALSAQDLEEVKKYAYLGQHAKAREAIDKYLAVEKNARKPEGWFYKGYTYNMVSKDSSLTLEQSAALKQEAFGALKKYREMDPKAELLTEQSNSPFFDMYAGYAQDLGIKAYNNKDYASAGKYFGEALQVHQYVFSNNLAGAGGFRFPALDTTLNLYAGIAYNQANMQEQGMTYLQKLSDAGVGGEQYLDVYQQLADYYRNKKDNAAFGTTIERGQKLYPQNNDYWVALEIENAVDGVEKPAVFDRYETLLAKYPDQFPVNYNYAVELYQYVNSEDRKTANNEEYNDKLVRLTQKAIQLNPKSIDAQFLMANFTYNHSIDLAETAQKIKGPKPEDLKRKKEMNARSTQMLDGAIPYAEKVVELFEATPKPKGSEKINYRQSLVILRNIYEMKKDDVRAAKYDKMVKALQ